MDRQTTESAPMKFAYADPPYYGRAKEIYDREYDQRT